MTSTVAVISRTGWPCSRSLSCSHHRGRPAQPADVADLVASVIASTYLTGEVIVMDGGLNLT
ncbi:hypothetical protein OHS81_32930 [Streptomyces sp. NBC_00400]|uniref:hypothetical protein n=1 Tax=Streptomyces sp. NBC_00400 TaxID=2975737 RepID=UPI002E1C67ED